MIRNLWYRIYCVFLGVPILLASPPPRTSAVASTSRFYASVTAALLVFAVLSIMLISWSQAGNPGAQHLKYVFYLMGMLALVSFLKLLALVPKGLKKLRAVIQESEKLGQRALEAEWRARHTYLLARLSAEATRTLVELTHHRCKTGFPYRLALRLTGDCAVVIPGRSVVVEENGNLVEGPTRWASATEFLQSVVR